MRLIIISILSLTLLSPASVRATSSSDKATNLPTKTNIFVPYTTEVPDGKWVTPWNNACEEASIVMIEAKYLGIHRRLGVTEAKLLMSPLFEWQDNKYGSNKDSNAARTAEIINNHSSFTARIVENPTVDSIKKELAAGRPVISLHYGFGLHNDFLRFRRAGSSFHVMVLKGYDENKQEFVVNDPGNERTGLDFHYKYDTIMDTLRDFDHDTGRADGPPRVIFTAPRQIVKAPDSHRVYLVENGAKRYITHPQVFTNHRWSWRLLRTVSRAELDALPTGADIKT